MDGSANLQDSGVMDDNVNLYGSGLMDGSGNHQVTGLLEGKVNLQGSGVMDGSANHKGSGVTNGSVNLFTGAAAWSTAALTSSPRHVRMISKCI